MEDSLPAEEKFPDYIDMSLDGPMWSDVTPVPIDEGDEAAVVIQFSEEFKEIMSYFRAILLKDEKSKRALWLTEKVIEHNPANYTAWYFRRECLKALNSDLRQELEFVTETAQEHPKNYQIWFHRRAIVDILGDGSNELNFTQDIIYEDSKNYHAWSHREWALQRFNLWEGELDFVDELLEDDLRNNSAWNQRWFVIENTKLKPNLSSPKTVNDIIADEIRYAQSYIDKAPSNESPYNYIVGLLRGRKFSDFPFVQEHAEQRFAAQTASENSRSSPYLLSLLVDIYSQDDKMKEKAIELCDQLAEKVDVIRKKYWRYRKAKIS